MWGTLAWLNMFLEANGKHGHLSLGDISDRAVTTPNIGHCYRTAPQLPSSAQET